MHGSRKAVWGIGFGLWLAGCGDSQSVGSGQDAALRPDGARLDGGSRDLSDDSGPDGGPGDRGGDAGAADAGGLYTPGAPAGGDGRIRLMTGLMEQGTFREVVQGEAVDWACPVASQGALGHLEAGVALSPELAAEIGDLEQVTHRYRAEAENRQVVARDNRPWRGFFQLQEDGSYAFDFAMLIIPDEEVGTNDPNDFEREPLRLIAVVDLPDGSRLERWAWIETDFDCPGGGG